MRKLSKVLCVLLLAGFVVVSAAGAIIWFCGAKSESRSAAVVTNGHECAEVGTSIMEKGGNAIEVAIATLFCEGIAMPQSMGLGGGFLMVFYNRTEQKAYSMNAREVAPAAATEDMFHGNSTASQRGAKAVAVPGELIGYWTLYQKFGGNLSWKELIQPTIDLCRNGVYVTEFLDGVLKSKRDLIYSDPVLRDIFIDPATKQTLVEGQYIKRLRLAKTLEIIAEEEGEAMHNGSLTKMFVKDIADQGGIITEDDMKNYRPVQEDPVVVPLDNGQTLFTSPLPGSGVVLAYILNVLSGFVDASTQNSVTVSQRIVESFKWAYGQRTQLGDPNYNNLTQLIGDLLSKEYAKETRSNIKDDSTSTDPSYYGAKVSIVEDHGTAHICILDKEGNAVAVTSTINYIFGAGFASNSTGIILNDEMADFSIPDSSNASKLWPSPSNFIAPGKRPLSSMVPSIIVNKDKDVVLVVGGAGGTKITTGVALVIMRHLWFDMNLKSAIDEKRFHHQLLPMNIFFDPEYVTEGKAIIDGLVKIGHNYTLNNEGGFGAVTGISRYVPKLESASDYVTAAFDRRRKGSISYL